MPVSNSSGSLADPLVMLGGGRMGEALLGGLLAAGAASVTVVEKDAPRRRQLEERYPSVSVVAGTGDLPVPGPAVDFVLAVKPADAAKVCRDLVATGVEIRRVVSIAAGVTLASLEEVLGPVAVIRAMPNTPALVGASATAISGGSAAGPRDLEWARDVLEAVGVVVELPESSLDAVTGLSGSGPAYVFMMAEALIDAGVLVGLTRPVAAHLAVQTLLGSARLLAETGEEPSALRAAVTSPGGTTAAGLRALEAGGLRHAVLEAVSAATARARELGAG